MTLGTLRPVRVSPPATPVATVGDFNLLARVDFSDDNALSEQFIQAATDHLDGYSGILGRCLINQSWRVSLADWPSNGLIRLPFPDVSAISSVVYYDADNAEQSIESANYQVIENERGTLVRFIDSFAAPSVYSDREDAVQVTFVAGYGAAENDVPMPLRVAVMMLAAHWYENREGQGDMPPSVKGLIAPYRRVGV